MISKSSATYATWKRLKKNKGALFGIVVIALSIVVALFAYVLAPDTSPFANRMIVEIGGQKPGHEHLFFLQPKEQKVPTVNIFERLVSGQPDKYFYVPVVRYKIQGRDSVLIEKYVDEGIVDTIMAANEAFTTETPARFETRTFILGTDKFGRDILSRLIIGVRVSLLVGLVAVVISLTVGIILGAVAGYFRGKTDDIIMWLINVVWSIPTLLLVFAITFLLGKGFWQVFVAVGLTLWVSVARMVRGQVLAIRELEYVDAAKVLGFSNFRIIFKHILPNTWGPVLVITASNFATAIVIEAGLSFLGVGVQPPQPSWGLMIKENYNFIITHNPALALAPGFAIMLLVLAFNLLGNGLRDALNVKE